MIPDSTIYICSNIKLRSDMAHTIYFSSLSAQRSYFAGKVVRTFTDYTIMRNNVAYVGADIADAETWNYAMIEDKANGDSLMRKFYFIESVEYIDEETTALYLKLDVMQTYQHQPNGGYAGNLPSCFVEREHSVYDGRYAFNGVAFNTMEENIDTGEFVIRSTNTITSGPWWIVAASTINLQEFTINSDVAFNSPGQIVNGLWSGIGLYAAPVSRSSEVVTLIQKLTSIGKSDGIQDLYLVPDEFINTITYGTGDQEYGRPFYEIDDAVATDHILALPHQFGTYTPRNKKLLQYPYMFAYLTDNKGLSTVYRPELFNPLNTPYDQDGSVSFSLESNVMQDAGIIIYPQTAYKGIPNNKEESITVSSFPHLPWVSDTYKLWLAQTANTRKYNLDQADFSYRAGIANIDLQSARNTSDMISGALTAVLTFGIVGSDKIANAFVNEGDLWRQTWVNDKTYELAKQSIEAQVKDHSITPPSSKGTSSGMLAWISGTINPKIQIKTVDDMHARIIDEYFDRYGYATNSFKVPNIHSRPAWNFVKTAGFDAKINIPQKYKVAISDCFNAGVTFWKNGDQIGNYAQNNAASTPS
jgi:hypothetical protein